MSGTTPPHPASSIMAGGLQQPQLPSWVPKVTTAINELHARMGKTIRHIHSHTLHVTNQDFTSSLLTLVGAPRGPAEHLSFGGPTGLV